MVSPGRDVFRGESGEVRDVLGEQCVSDRHRNREEFGIGKAKKPVFGDGARLDARDLQRFG